MIFGKDVSELELHESSLLIGILPAPNNRVPFRHPINATKYRNIVTNFFAQKGIRAECIKLNGSVELAPKLGICSTIIDLVSTGKTLKENNLEESEIIMKITSKLIINKIAFKLMNSDIRQILDKFKMVTNG